MKYLEILIFNLMNNLFFTQSLRNEQKWNKIIEKNCFEI
jgi:hypothetical protein